jgi:hypothetical protein
MAAAAWPSKKWSLVHDCIWPAAAIPATRWVSDDTDLPYASPVPTACTSACRRFTCSRRGLICSSIICCKMFRETSCSMLCMGTPAEEARWDASLSAFKCSLTMTLASWPTDGFAPLDSPMCATIFSNVVTSSALRGTRQLTVASARAGLPPLERSRCKSSLPNSASAMGSRLRETRWPQGSAPRAAANSLGSMRRFG